MLGQSCGPLLLQASPLTELHKNSRAKALHEEQAREAEERFRREHTFKPTLYHKSSRGQGHLALPQAAYGSKENGSQDGVPAAHLILHKEVLVHLQNVNLVSVEANSI